MIKNDYIKNYWENQGKKYKSSHWASWGDDNMINLEINLISEYIKPHNVVLDAGCANGYGAFKQYENNKLIKITGIDYAKNMINGANSYKNKHYKNNPNINFDTGDIRNLKFSDNTFDVTYTTRVLINLPNWEEQKQGLDEVIRVSKKGGTVILSEAFWEPLTLLNSIRALKTLSPLVEHDFNRYLKFSLIDKYLSTKKLSFKRIDFSSIYYLGSRFIRELVTNVDEYEGYSNPINKFFYDLEIKFSGGGFGIQQAYIITK